MKRELPEVRFRRLFEQYYGAVHAYALRRLPSAADADDLVADTFVVLWRRLESAPADDDEMLPWLYGVARRLVANRLRGGSRMERLKLRLRSRAAEEPSVHERVEVRSEIETLIRAFGLLSRDDQEILRLAAWERLSNRDLAIVLGCSENAAAIRLHRARHRLRHIHLKDNAVAGHKEAAEFTKRCEPTDDESAH